MKLDIIRLLFVLALLPPLPAQGHQKSIIRALKITKEFMATVGGRSALMPAEAVQMQCKGMRMRRPLRGLLVSLGALLLLSGLAGSDSSGPNSPTLGQITAGVGTLAWADPTNIYTHDSLWATASIGKQADTTTNYLNATNFGLSIPTGSTIKGIQAEIEHNASSQSNAGIVVSIVHDRIIVGSHYIELYACNDCYCVFANKESVDKVRICNEQD